MDNQNGFSDPGEQLLEEIWQKMNELLPLGGKADRTFAAMLNLSNRIMIDRRLKKALIANRVGWARMLTESRQPFTYFGFLAGQAGKIRKELQQGKRLLLIVGKTNPLQAWGLGKLPKENLSTVIAGGLFTAYQPAPAIRQAVETLAGRDR